MKSNQNNSRDGPLPISRTKSVSSPGEIKKSEEPIKKSSEKMKSKGGEKKKKCLIIKRSSVQFAEEVIESPITVIASHLFLLMWFSVKGERLLVWNYWTLPRLNGNEMKHHVIKEGIRPQLDTKDRKKNLLWYSKKPTEVDVFFFLWKSFFFSQSPRSNSSSVNGAPRSTFCHLFTGEMGFKSTSSAK